MFWSHIFLSKDTTNYVFLGAISRCPLYLFLSRKTRQEKDAATIRAKNKPNKKPILLLKQNGFFIKYKICLQLFNQQPSL
jgi:hypothetical protein